MIAGRGTATFRFEGDADQAENRSLMFRANMRRLVHSVHLQELPGWACPPMGAPRPRLALDWAPSSPPSQHGTMKSWPVGEGPGSARAGRNPDTQDHN